MCMRAVHWALHDAPMLTTEKGTNDTTARLTLVALADKAQGDPPISFASAATLELMTGLERKAIHRALIKLSQAALIVAVGKRGRTTRWRLDLSRKRPASDLEEVAREVEVDRERARERMRHLRAVRTSEGRTHTPSVRDSGGRTARPVFVPPGDESTGSVRDSEGERSSLRGANTQCSSFLNGKDEQENPPVVPPADDGLLPLAALAETDPGRRSIPIGAGPDTWVPFAEFWAVYPRRVGRKEAERKFGIAVKGGADPAEIIAGAKRYAEWRKGQDSKFTKHPSTWLNQGCWEDEPDRSPPKSNSNGYQPWKNPTDQSAYDEDLY